MSFWEMDDGFVTHHKTRRAVRAGSDSIILWMAMRTYVALHLTDGFVPDDEIEELPGAPKNPRRWIKVLVECGKPERDGSRGAGLLDEVDGGWMLHDYLDHALPAEEIRRRKRDSAARQKAWRAAKQTRSVTHNATHNETCDVTQTERVANTPPYARAHSHPIPSHDLIQPEKQIQRPDRLGPDEKPDDLQQLCLRLRGNPTEGQFTPVQSRPEVVAVAHAFWDGQKLAHQRLGSYGRDSAVTAICERYADGFTQEELLAACKAAATDEYIRKQRHPSPAHLTPEVVRRLLQPPREEPKMYPGYKTAAQLESEEAATRARLDAEERARVARGKRSTGTSNPRPGAKSSVLPIAIKTVPDSGPKKKRSRQEELAALAELEESNATAP